MMIAKREVIMKAANEALVQGLETVSDQAALGWDSP